MITIKIYVDTPSFLIHTTEHSSDNWKVHRYLLTDLSHTSWLYAVPNTLNILIHSFTPYHSKFPQFHPDKDIFSLLLEIPSKSL